MLNAEDVLFLPSSKLRGFEGLSASAFALGNNMISNPKRVDQMQVFDLLNRLGCFVCRQIWGSRSCPDNAVILTCSSYAGAMLFCWWSNGSHLPNCLTLSLNQIYVRLAPYLRIPLLLGFLGTSQRVGALADDRLQVSLSEGHDSMTKCIQSDALGSCYFRFLVQTFSLYSLIDNRRSHRPLLRVSWKQLSLSLAHGDQRPLPGKCQRLLIHGSMHIVAGTLATSIDPNFCTSRFQDVFYMLFVCCKTTFSAQFEYVWNMFESLEGFFFAVKYRSFAPAGHPCRELNWDHIGC